MKQLLFFAAFILMASTLNAQNMPPQGGRGPGGSGRAPQAPATGYGKIQGTILDSETGEPVPFATIALVLMPMKKIVDGTIADEKGKFSLKSIPAGTYQISVSFIGFEPVDKFPLEITEKGNEIDLGEITMTMVSKELDEVVVQGERELFEDKVDRLIYNAEKDETTKGGDATDVLKRVPLLTVDLDGNVTLRGSQNIRVLIDNRPSTITAGSVADALKQIPADQIKSVEVITAPSARYDAEGTGGIINIITKKNNLQGSSLSINSSAGVRGSNLGLNAGYRKGKTGFSLGGHGRSGYNINGKYLNEQTLTDLVSGTETRTTQAAATQNTMLMGRYTLGADHEFNKYNWVSGSVRFGVFNFNGSQDNLTTRTLQNDLLLRSTLQDISMINLSNNIDASLNYVKTFETPRKELSILTQYSQNNRTNDFINASLNEVDESIISQLKNNNQSYNSELTLQLDYVAPLKNDQTLEIGGKTITRTVNSDFTYFLATGPDGAFVPQGQASLTNVFDYNQSVSAGYMTYARNFQKDYSAKIGARYEYTDIHANFLDNLKLDIPAYGLLVPSVNLSKKLAQGNMIKAAYNRRIQRPSLQFLNPNIQAANPKNITQGNPNLAPEFSDNIELTFSTFKKGTSINISTFLRNTNGSIQPVREVIGQDTIYTTYQNIGEEDAYGTSLFANLKLGDKLSINGGFDTYYAVLKNNVADPLYNASNQGFVVSGRVFGSYDFTDKWGLQFFSFIRGRQVQLQGHQSGFYMYSLSVKRDFNNEKGSIGFGAENFLTNGIVRINAVQSAFIDQVNTNVMYNMNFKVNFSYRIGKMDASAAPRRRARSVQNNDLKQGEGNDDMNQRK